MSNPTLSKTHASWEADREAWLKREAVQKIVYKDKNGTVTSTENIERGPRYVAWKRLKERGER
jgi:hypothetical protein